MAIQENITQNQPPIDDKAVALLYEDLKDSYDVGSLEDFIYPTKVKEICFLNRLLSQSTM